MGEDQKQREVIILPRLLTYSEKAYDLSELIEGVKDKRIHARIKTPVVFGSALVMALIRMGSLNALEQTSGNSFWKRWIGESLPSSDTIGRVFALLDTNNLRAAIKHIYSRLKRNKALRPVSPVYLP